MRALLPIWFWPLAHVVAAQLDQTNSRSRSHPLQSRLPRAL